MNEISPMKEVNVIKNSCRCKLLDYMLRQLAAKRRESELLGHPLDNPCIDEMLRNGDAVCCTMVFVNFLTFCCDGCVTQTNGKLPRGGFHDGCHGRLMKQDQKSQSGFISTVQAYGVCTFISDASEREIILRLISAPSTLLRTLHKSDNCTLYCG